MVRKKAEWERSRAGQASADRLLDALREAVEASHVPLDEVGRRMGRERGYVSHLLAGRMGLSAEHVFGILEAIKEDPGRFFAKTFPPKPTSSGPSDAELFRSLQGFLERLDGRVTTVEDSLKKKR